MTEARKKEKKMNLMVKMGRGLAHVWTSAGRIVALVGVCNEVVDAVTFRCEMDGLSRKTRFSICAIGNEVGIVFCTKLKVAEGVWIRRYSNIGVVCIACFLVGKCPLGGRTRCLVPGKSSGCT